MNHYFVICDREEAYVERFTALLNERKLVPWRIEGVTDPESLEEFCRTHRVEVLLMEEELFRERTGQFAAKKTLLLTALPSRETEDILFKYQSVVEMMEKIMCCQKEEAMPVSIHPVQLVGIYSPVKRCQKTLFALSMGQILAKEQAVLYLNFSSLSGLQVLLGKEQEADLSDLLYLMAQGRKKPDIWKTRCIQTINNLDYILPVQSPADLHDTDASAFSEILRILRESGDYRTILLELDESCPACLSLLQECSAIYMPVEEDTLSAAQLGQYEQLLGRMGSSSVLKKTIRIRPPWHSGMGEKGQFVEQLVWGELGDYVRRLLWGK